MFTGQQPQNPLLLLEQYSDELDADSKEVQSAANADDAPIGTDEQVILQK